MIPSNTREEQGQVSFFLLYYYFYINIQQKTKNKGTNILVTLYGAEIYVQNFISETLFEQPTTHNYNELFSSSINFKQKLKELEI